MPTLNVLHVTFISGLVAEWIRRLPSTQTAGFRSPGWTPPDSSGCTTESTSSVD